MLRTEQRIAALENAQTPSEGMTIIRRMVAHGHLDAEIDHIRDAHGSEWTRQHGEAEAAFTDRAASKTPPNSWSVKSLVCSNLELHHATH